MRGRTNMAAGGGAKAETVTGTISLANSVLMRQRFAYTDGEQSYAVEVVRPGSVTVTVLKNSILASDLAIASPSGGIELLSDLHSDVLGSLNFGKQCGYVTDDFTIG